MRDTNFKVGDRVRVLAVKQMKKEFGNPICCRCSFVDDMNKYCGRELTIRSLTEEGKDKNGNKNWFVSFEEGGLGGFSWSTDMIEKVNPDIKFKVGDRIRIRQYEDMKAEFGVTRLGDIDISPIFNKKGMSWLCGKQATIGEIKSRVKGVYDVTLIDREDESGGDWKWTFTTQMIEKVEGKEMPKYKVGDKVILRTYDDLVKEYGKDKNGRIKTPITINLDMVELVKEYGGKVVTIRSIYDNNVDFNELCAFTWSTCVILRKADEDKPKFKVGDRVRVRAWDDLVEEFGKDKSGDLKTRPIFVSSMKRYCGLEAVVCHVNGDDSCNLDGCEHWNFDVRSLELIEDKPMPKGGKPVGEIKSIEDAIVALAGKNRCSGTPCSKCVMKQRFGKGKTINCSQIAEDAVQFALNWVEGKGAETPQPEKKVTRKPLGSGKCKDCVHKEPLAGGYYFCKKWYNVTLEDGYCHYYEKLEKKKKEVEEE